MSTDLQKKIWRFVRFGLLGLATLIVLAVLYFVSPFGRGLVASALLDALGGTGKASAVKIGGNWPGQLTLDGIVLADQKGIWLTVKRADLSWRPLALLRGRLTIDTLSLDHPELLRQPEGAPPQKEKQGGGSLPVAIDAQNIVIDNGVVHGANNQLFGFDAKGAALLDSVRKSATLALVRRGGPDEHARISALVDAATHRIALAADIKAVAGGLFAQLLGQPDLPAFVVEAGGAGPPTQWKFGGHAEGGGYGALALRGVLSWTDRLVIDASGSFLGGDALPQNIRTILGTSAAVSSHYEQDGAGAMSGRLGLGADRARLDATAELKAGGLFEGRPLDGTLSLRTVKPVALGDSKIDGTTADAVLSGTLAHPKLALKLGVASAHFDEYSLSNLTGDFVLSLAPGLVGRSFALDGKGTVGDASANGGSFLGHGGFTLAAKGNLDRTSLDDGTLTLTSDALGLDAKGRYGANGAAAFEAKLTANRLETLSPLIDLDLKGAGTINASLSRAGDGAPLAASLQGRFENAVLDGTDLTPLAGKALLLDAKLTQDRSGVLAVKDLSLTGDHLSLKGGGQLRPTLDAKIDLDANLEGLAAFAHVPASGKARGHIDLRGPLGRPRLAILLNSPDAVISGRTIGALKVALIPAADAPVPNGRLNVTSRGPLGGANLTVPIIHADHVWTIGPFTGTAFGGQVAGQLRRAQGDLTGSVKAVFTSLSGLYSLERNTPSTMEGRMALNLTLGNGRDLSLNATGRDIRGKNGHFAIGKLNLDAARKAEQVTANATLADLRVPGVTAPIDSRRLVLTAQGTDAALNWHLVADALTGGNGKLDSSGSLRTKDQTTVLAFSNLSGMLWREPVALEAPSTLTMSETGLTLKPFALKIGVGRVALNYQQVGRNRKADFAASALPLAFVGRVLETDWPQGRIEGNAGIDIKGARASGFLDFSLANALFTRMAKGVAQPVEGRFKGNWNGAALTLDATGSNGALADAQPLLLTAKLPLTYRAASGAIGMDKAGPVSGQIHWRGRLGALWALLPYDLHRLDGDAQVEGTASGRFGAPKLAGTLAVQHGIYESIATGTRLRNVVIDAAANGGNISLKLSGEDWQGGALNGSGTLQPGDNGALNASVEFRKLRLVGLDNLTAEATGPVKLTGTAASPRLEGNLQLDHVDAAIPDRLPPSIAMLPVKEVGDIASSMPQPEEAPQTEGQSITLALDVRVPGQAFLRGRGLTSEWRGRLSVKGTSTEPRVTGIIELVKGDIAFAGRSYALTRGRAVFDGGPKVDPTLDIATERSVSGTTVALTVSGRASAPALEITSNPTLPRDQAMALFLFGKPAQSLTALELIDVARSVAQLSGTSGGFDPLEKARRALGLDVLTVDVNSGAGTTGGTSSIASGTTLSAGRYISRKVYLGVKQGASTSSSALQLDYSLTPHLSVGTEVGVSSGEAVNMNYKWDY